MNLKRLISLPFALIPLACGLSGGGDDDGGTVGGSTGGSGIIIGQGGSSTSAQGGSTGSGATPGTGGGISVGNGGSGTAGDGNVISKEGAKELEDAACAGTKIEPESLPAVLQIVLDNSASMGQSTRSTNGRSKWEITRDALKDTIDALPGNIAIGLLYFPNMNTSSGREPRDVSACVNVDAMIPIDVLGDANSAQRERLTSSLDRTSPAGSTPTHDAYNYGLDNSLLLTDAPGARYMLLMTDGGPTLSLQCIGEGTPTSPQPQQPIIDAVQAALVDHGVKSFLVGVPGTENIGDQAMSDGRPWMSTAAVLGGTALPGCSVRGPNWCHIDLTQDADFSAALRRSLGQVTGSIISCDYEIPPEGDNGEPINLSQVNVLYGPGDGSDDQLIRQNNNAGCEDGWQITGNTLTLCPNTCNLIKSDLGAKLEVLFGCDTESVPVR